MSTNVNLRNSLAVYAQIENQARFAIASGQLKAADRLLFIQELAERFPVNPNTAAKSYRDLEVMGYVHTRRGMGVFINKGIDETCREDCRRGAVSRLYEVITEAKAAGITATELKDIMQKCVAVASTPYSEMPTEILTLTKQQPTARKWPYRRNMRAAATVFTRFRVCLPA
jgi:GntR family transcriptional regulator